MEGGGGVAGDGMDQIQLTGCGSSMLSTSAGYSLRMTRLNLGLGVTLFGPPSARISRSVPTSHQPIICNLQ